MLVVTAEHDQEYVKGANPLVGVKVVLPLHVPEHGGSVVTAVTATADGDVTVPTTVTEHELASVIVTEYVEDPPAVTVSVLGVQLAVPAAGGFGLHE